MGVVLIEIFVMTITRAHYMIDVVFGVLFAHYFYFLSFKLTPFFDRFIPIFYGSSSAAVITEIKPVVSKQTANVSKGETPSLDAFISNIFFKIHTYRMLFASFI